MAANGMLRGLSGPHPGGENCVQNALLTGPAPGGRGGVRSSWPSETHPLLLAPYPGTPSFFPACFPPILRKSYRTRLPNQEIFSPGTDERWCGFWSSPLYPDREPHHGAPTPPPHLHMSLTCILPREFPTKNYGWFHCAMSFFLCLHLCHLRLGAP